MVESDVALMPYDSYLALHRPPPLIDQVMIEFFTWLADLPVSDIPLSGHYRYVWILCCADPVLTLC